MLIKILHITLIFSLLTSSVGVVVNQHFCRGELKHTTLFTAVKSCHDTATKEQPACPFHQKDKDQEGVAADNDCCNNDSHYLKCSQEQQMEQSVLPVLTIPAIAAFSLSDFADLHQVAAQRSGKYYRPPPLLTDITIQFQIFRL